MSYSIDTNILLYASDRSSPHHDAATAFLARCAAGGDLLYLAWPTLMGYLRVATHPSIFGRPLSPSAACGNVQALLDLPHCRMLAEEEGFWQQYNETTDGQVVRGNLVPDAHLAALLEQHGVRTLYTADRDFLRFDFLRVVNPLA